MSQTLEEQYDAANAQYSKTLNAHVDAMRKAHPAMHTWEDLTRGGPAPPPRIWDQPEFRPNSERAANRDRFGPRYTEEERRDKYRASLTQYQSDLNQSDLKDRPAPTPPSPALSSVWARPHNGPPSPRVSAIAQHSAAQHAAFDSRRAPPSPHAAPRPAPTASMSPPSPRPQPHQSQPAPTASMSPPSPRPQPHQSQPAPTASMSPPSPRAPQRSLLDLIPAQRQQREPAMEH